jgi:hypothetical protein
VPDDPDDPEDRDTPLDRRVVAGYGDRAAV